MSHAINATIMRSDVVPERHRRLFFSLRNPEYAIASTTNVVRSGMDISSIEHVDISTDYSGGFGSQYASYSHPDAPVMHFPDKTQGGAINTALALLDVPEEEGKDLFDALGLGKFRNYRELEPINEEQ